MAYGSLSMQLSHIFKHDIIGGVSHNLYKVKGKEKYLYVLSKRDIWSLNRKWFNSEASAKEYVLKMTGRNPFKEIQVEET